MQIFIDNMPVEAQIGESLLNIIKRLGLDAADLSKRPLAADLGGEVFTLNYVPCREQDKLPASVGYRERRGIRRSKGRISLIRYGENRGQRIYERTLLFVFLLAVRELFPDAHVRVNYAIGAGLYITLQKNTPLIRAEVDALRRKCREIVAADYVLERKRVDIDEAIAFFEKDGQRDKVRLLNYRQFTYFDVYRHEDYVDYFYGEMCPSTGYASVMNLQYEHPGLFLLRPSAKDINKPSTYVKSPRFAAVFAESDRWARLMHCASVADLNDMVMSGTVRELIRVNEALHEKRFAEIASQIVSRSARAILIAGPSSSGKTTSANRLCTQLRVLGKTPLLFSLDDYYKDRSLVDPEPDGTFDYEHIKMIDVARFNRDLSALLQGEAVTPPTFDFSTGRSLPGSRTIRLTEDTPMIIEGLHALNPQLLTPEIDPKDVFKLYVSALTTLNLDDHNRIPTSDVRLLRRLVRDYLTRGATVERTLDMWDSVQRGEHRWIFPYQESADAIFNTALVYELAILKRHIFPLLQSVAPASPCYDQVRNIIKFLNYVQDADLEDEIPPTSILREFIGGNTFYLRGGKED
jgi:uridine kinase